MSACRREAESPREVPDPRTLAQMCLQGIIPLRSVLQLRCGDRFATSSGKESTAAKCVTEMKLTRWYRHADVSAGKSRPY